MVLAHPFGTTAGCLTPLWPKPFLHSSPIASTTKTMSARSFSLGCGPSYNHGSHVLRVRSFLCLLTVLPVSLSLTGRMSASLTRAKENLLPRAVHTLPSAILPRQSTWLRFGRSSFPRRSNSSRGYSFTAASTLVLISSIGISSHWKSPGAPAAMAPWKLINTSSLTAMLLSRPVNDYTSPSLGIRSDDPGRFRLPASSR